MAFYSTPIKAVAHIYIHAETLDVAEQKFSALVSKVFDINKANFAADFKNGDHSAPEMSLENLIWAEEPLSHLELKRVSRAKMADQMAGVGETRAITPVESKSHFDASGMTLYWAHTEVRCTAFIRARTLHDAWMKCGDIRGQFRIDQWSGWFTEQFTPAGLDLEMRYVFSPRMEVVGLSEGHPLKQVWPEDAATKAAKAAAAQKRAANYLRQTLAVLGAPFETMTVDDAVAIIGLAKDMLKGRSIRSA